MFAGNCSISCGNSQKVESNSNYSDSKNTDTEKEIDDYTTVYINGIAYTHRKE